MGEVAVEKAEEVFVRGEDEGDVAFGVGFGLVEGLVEDVQGDLREGFFPWSRV